MAGRGRPKKEIGDEFVDNTNMVGDEDPLFPNGILGELEFPNNDEEEENTDEVTEETTEEEENTTEITIEEENNSTDNTEVSPIKILANYLRDEGIVDFKDDEFKDEDTFINEIIETQINKGIDSYKEELPDVIKDLINNYEEGVPLNELLGLKVQNENYLNLTEENVKDSEILQKNVIREHYRRLGYKEEKINSKIEKLEARAELEEESLESLTELKEILKIEEEQYKKQQKQSQKQKLLEFENTKKEYKSLIDSKEEIFKGIKLTPKHKEELFNGIFTPDKDGKNEYTKRIEKDPEFSLKVAYMTLILNWDLTAFEKLATNKASGKLRDLIDSSKDRLRGNGIDANKSTGQKFDFSTAAAALNKLK